jgi:hypothetical protein
MVREHQAAMRILELVRSEWVAVVSLGNIGEALDVRYAMCHF